MKNLLYYKQECMLCNGKKEVQVSPNDSVLYICGRYMFCPLCNGAGYLTILNVENKKENIYNQFKNNR